MRTCGVEGIVNWKLDQNIFEKDISCYPYHECQHYSGLAVIHIHQSHVESLSELKINASAMDTTIIPCIVHCDSIEGSHNGLKAANLLCKALEALWLKEKGFIRQFRIGIDIEFVSLSYLFLQQQGCINCGLTTQICYHCNHQN